MAEDDKRPIDIKQAVITIYSSILIGIVYMFILKGLFYSDDNNIGKFINGTIDFLIFINIFISGIYSLIPYFIYNRSNLARYLYTVLTIMGIIVLFLIPFNLSDFIYNIIQFILTIYILIKLYSKKSNIWFRK